MTSLPTPAPAPAHAVGGVAAIASLSALLLLAGSPLAAAHQALPTGGSNDETATAWGGESMPALGEVQISAAITELQPALSARQGPLTLEVAAAGLTGKPIVISGHLANARSAQTIVIEGHPASGVAWKPIARAKSTSAGSFSTNWRAHAAGRMYLRARLAAAAGASSVPAATSDPQVTIFRASRATWYGPGFYGSRTACGQRLTSKLIGVANRTLPCGTLVEVSLGSRALLVPVIDRGPYRTGVSWDLTAHAAQLLGADGIASVGALVVGSADNTASLGSPPAPAGSAQNGGTTPAATP